MKTIKTYFPLFVLGLLVAATGLLKAQPGISSTDHFLNLLDRNQPEEKTAPLPFNTAKIASEALFQKLEKEYFFHDNEEAVAPLPAGVQKMAYQVKLEKAWKLASVQEEEPQIDDLSPAVKQFMAAYRKTLMADAEKK